MGPEEATGVLGRLGDLDHLPSLPHVTSELLSRLKDPDSSAQDVSALLSQDPTLTAQMLRMVNSAYYGLSQEVSSLGQATTLLGYRQVRSVVLSAAAKGVFSLKCKSPCFSQEGFTLHGIAAAAVARHLARISRAVDPEIAFSLGLLHDIGKLVIDQLAPHHYTAIVETAKADESTFVDAEEKLGIPGHCEVGAVLARKWRMPPLLAEGIRHHHCADLAAGHRLTPIMLITDHICKIKHAGAPDDFTEARLNSDAWHHLKIPANALAEILKDVDEHIAGMRQMFGT